MAFPATRLRRLRATTGIRDLVRETELAARHLVYPMFVVHGSRGEAGDEPLGEAVASTQATAWEDSSAGMIPSSLATCWKAASAWRSVTAS